jgi:hypothetical protein
MLRRQQPGPDPAKVIYFDNPDPLDEACTDGIDFLSNQGGLNTGPEDLVTLTLESNGDTVIVNSNDTPPLSAGIGGVQATVLLSRSVIIQEGQTSLAGVPASKVTVTADRMARVIGYIITINTNPPARGITVSREDTTLTIDSPKYQLAGGFAIDLVTEVSATGGSS